MTGSAHVNTLPLSSNPARRTPRNTQRTKHNAQHTKHHARYHAHTTHHTSNTKHQTLNTKHQTPNTKHQHRHQQQQHQQQQQQYQQQQPQPQQRQLQLQPTTIRAARCTLSAAPYGDYQEHEDKHDAPRRQKPPPPQPVLFSLYDEEPAGGGLPARQSRQGRKSGSSSAPWSSQPNLLPWYRSSTYRCRRWWTAGGRPRAPRHAVTCRAGHRSAQDPTGPHPALCGFRAAAGGTVRGSADCRDSRSWQRAFHDRHGHEWVRVLGPTGVYFWKVSTNHTQWDLPEGYTASPGRYINTGQG